MIETKLPKIYLKAGEVYIAKKPSIVWTVLGSCLSVILYSKAHKISAISHAQLPTPNKRTEHNLKCSLSCPSTCLQKDEEVIDELRFVSCSIKYMVDKLGKLGIAKKDLKAAIYGGAQLFDSAKDLFLIGPRNLKEAHFVLNDLHIPIINENVLGNKSRLINFRTAEGIVSINKQDTERL